MKTSLKRGTGRDGTNGAPAFPPAPLTPVSRYGPPRRRGPLRVIGKILLWTLVVLLVAAGALAGGVYLWLNETFSSVSAKSAEVRDAQEALDVAIPGAPTVAIVIGYDSRAGADKGNAPRSDTVMLIRADPDLKTVSMLSFPRDLVVDIPGCRRHEPFRARINEAFTACGPRGTLETVKNLTGVPVNYMITVNFNGFIQVVNKLGGVFVDIDRRYLNTNEGLGFGQTFARIDLHPGYQRLSGAQALSFVRYRHTDSDLYRNVRQQEFVKALKQQINGFWSISKVPGIVNVMKENVEVGVAGGKTLDFETVYGYARLVYELPAGNFHQSSIDGLTGYYELSAPPGAIEAAVEQFMNPDAEAAEKAATAATGGRSPSPEREGPAPRDVSIEVLNGNGIAGSADEAAFLLSKRGYEVTNGGNAQRFDYFETTVLYDTADPDGEAAADGVARLFGDAEVEAAPAGTELETTLQVLVGQTFKGTLTPGPSDTTPEHQPPSVVRDTAPGQLIRQAQRRVDFPLLVPTMRETNSALDSTEPMRVYRINRQDAVRLTFNGPEGLDYWGIQQAAWDDPPILDGPSTTRTLDGREYRLFFDGPRLHMIGFVENGASYWVVNTLLNRLSNETMIAIARGLQPAT